MLWPCEQAQHAIFWVSLLGLAHNVASAPPPPHIVVVVIDDLGSNDLGLQGSGIHTPTIDHLVLGNRTDAGGGVGTLLSNYYVLPYCSPTRAALLTGRYPLHTGCHQIIFSENSFGLPLDEDTLPSMLRDSGYATHAVGKWHLGHSQWEQTPTFRGFESFYGIYMGSGDHFQHRNGGAYDMHHDARPRCGAGCSKFVDERGNYSTTVFTRESLRVIHEHAANQNEHPLFLYLAHQAVHHPDQVPRHYRDIYNNRTAWGEKRKIYAGMLTAVDDSVREVVQALQATGLWENTVLMITTDNGGPTDICAVQGSSNRHRGGKCTVWEGGTRGDAILAGPAVPQRKDKHYDNLFHVVDWLPTLAALVGIQPNGKKSLDGVNHVGALFDPDQTSPRQELFIGYAQFEDAPWYGPAIRWNYWKLLQGVSGGAEAGSLHPPGHPDTPSPPGNSSDAYQLFHLLTDPYETTNVLDQHPFMARVMQDKLRQYGRTYVPPLEDDPQCTPFRGHQQNPEYGTVLQPWCSRVVVYE